MVSKTRRAVKSNDWFSGELSGWHYPLQAPARRRLISPAQPHRLAFDFGEFATIAFIRSAKARSALPSRPLPGFARIGEQDLSALGIPKPC
jgi:hypothetical protein